MKGALGRLRALVVVLAFSAAATQSAAAGLEIASSRADVVSGSEALVRATSVLPDNARVRVNGVDTSARLAPDAAGRMVARVQGLKPGRNVIELRSGDRTIGSIAVRAYPAGGPIFSGPRQMPWVCETEGFAMPDGSKLPPASGPDCSVPTAVTYLYRTTNGVLKPFPVGELPGDLATTTIRGGREVNFIVRIETGTLNRGIYQTALLFDPTQDAEPNPWKRPAGWNGSLIYVFGGSCGPGYHQGRSTAPILRIDDLARGYAVASSTLNVWGNVCNSVVSAEAMTMVKARFVTTFGIVDHTIGVGLSGGAKSQFQIADNYPGLLGGILPGIQAGGPDGVSTNAAVLDCSLLMRYFNARSTQAWTHAQKTAVAGWAGWNNCERSDAEPAPAVVPGGRPAVPVFRSNWGGLFSPNYVRPMAHQPAQAIGCAPAIKPAWIYDPDKNPRGVRCDVYSAQINLFGERTDKPGFPRRPLDNVGLQYGLAAFNAGLITADQFIELNARIGGYDDDGNMVDARTQADPQGLAIAYRTGQVTRGGGGLDEVPIIDLRLYTDTNPDIHDRVGSFVARARLKATHGDAENMVMYTYPFEADALVNRIALDEMTDWLDRIAADHSSDPKAVKVRRNKPPALTDACWDASLSRIAEPAAYAGTTRCNALFPTHGNPRLAAGMPLTFDVLKCQLMTVDPKAYAQSITPTQLKRLQDVFPGGVCDFSKPGVGQQPLAGTWFAYPERGRPARLPPVD